MRNRRVRLGDGSDLGVVEADAVGEQRTVVEHARAREPVDDADTAAGERIALVSAVLGRVDVEPDRMPRGDLRAAGERLVREREGRVSADEARGRAAAARD